MNVGKNEAPELKELAMQRNLPFANLLRSYVLEDLLLRIYQSQYQDFLWLRDDGMLTEEGCRRGGEDTIGFFYQESSRLLSVDKLVPGQKLTRALAEQFIAQVLQPGNIWKVNWRGEAQEQPGKVALQLNACYRQMQVPVHVELRTICLENQRPEKRTYDTIAIPGHVLTCQVYSSENQLSTDLFEIMDKLELIGDMGAYYRAYRTLQTQPLSGRHIMEELTELAAKRPQIKKERRLEQLKGYRDYAYMRKRWDQYVKRHGGAPAAWEDALDLILVLLEPLWKAFCRDEVFFDEWMPELGRLF